ncbi:uncharacterized protein LOC123544975 [Mercenaria mercenaria]|uniref:uncharacterized protein LOC123544975 n=1 Tax=Mercenaria mercenaria TaxID=6596 RepID=UPI00234F213C|nr:uncharacterized protein LOC123544975 [Mercenaria mercenaria]
MKPRRLPPGGFYPTVGLFATSDRVRVRNPGESPTVPPEARHLLKKWAPVYRDFIFDETITFDNYERLGSTARISVKDFRKKSYIHCISNRASEYFFTFEIIDFGEEGEIHVSPSYKVSDTEMSRDTPQSLCFSRKTDLAEIGNKVFIIMFTSKESNLTVATVVDGKIKSVIPLQEGNEFAPCIYFHRGPIVLDVT